MGNNPGEKGEPAPWTNREREDRATALQRYLDERLPEYAAWRQSRHEKFAAIHKLADDRYPRVDIGSLSDDYVARSQAARANVDNERRKKNFIRRHQRIWDEQHPSPMTWEKRQALEAEFTKKLTFPTDRS
jgi:hypothetical protein